MSYVMPALILLLLGYALCKRVNVYDAFTRGAQEALPLLAQVLPFMAAMLIPFLRCAFRAHFLD